MVWQYQHYHTNFRGHTVVFFSALLSSSSSSRSSLLSVPVAFKMRHFLFSLHISWLPQIHYHSFLATFPWFSIFWMDRVLTEFSVFQYFFHVIQCDVSVSNLGGHVYKLSDGHHRLTCLLPPIQTFLSNVSSISGVHNCSLTLVHTLSSSSSLWALILSSKLLLSSVLLLPSDTSMTLSMSSEGSSVTELSSTVLAHGWATALWCSMLYLLVKSLRQSGH